MSKQMKLTLSLVISLVIFTASNTLCVWLCEEREKRRGIHPEPYDGRRKELRDAQRVQKNWEPIPFARR